MTIHRCKLIRDAIITQLTPVVTVSPINATIADTDLTLVVESDLPHINVITARERPGDYKIITQPRAREMVIETIIQIRHTEGKTESVSEKIDIIRQLIETTITGDLGGAIDGLVSCDYAGFDPEWMTDGNRHSCTATVLYEATMFYQGPYNTDNTNAIDSLYMAYDMIDLYKSDVETGPDGQIDAEDRLLGLDPEA